MASSILVKNIPAELYREIRKEQGQIQAMYGTTYSLEKTIVKMLRDYIKCKKNSNFKSDEL